MGETDPGFRDLNVACDLLVRQRCGRLALCDPRSRWVFVSQSQHDTPWHDLSHFPFRCVAALLINLQGQSNDGGAGGAKEPRRRLQVAEFCTGQGGV